MADTEEKHAGGRPTKYDPATVEKLVAGFQRDFTVEEACHYADIDKQTYYNWLEKYPEFFDKIEHAKTYLFRQSKELVTDAIRNGKNANMAKWFLSKRNAAYNKTQIELSGEVDTHSGDDKLLTILEELVKKDADNDSGQPNTDTEAPAS